MLGERGHKVYDNTKTISQGHAAQYLVEGIPCTLYPPKFADLLAYIPQYVAEKNAEVRFALASTVQETLPSCFNSYNKDHHPHPCLLASLVTCVYTPSMSIFETYIRSGKMVTYMALPQTLVKRLGLGTTPRPLLGW